MQLLTWILIFGFCWNLSNGIFCVEIWQIVLILQSGLPLLNRLWSSFLWHYSLLVQWMTKTAEATTPVYITMLYSEWWEHIWMATSFADISLFYIEWWEQTWPQSQFVIPYTLGDENRCGHSTNLHAVVVHWVMRMDMATIPTYISLLYIEW
jgi:hypothetical protein